MQIEKPNEVDAERELLAACFTGGGPTFPSDEVMKLAVAALSPEYLVHPHYNKIYVGMVEAMYDSGQGSVGWGEVRGYIDKSSAARDTLRDIVTNSNIPPVSERFVTKLIDKLTNAYRSRKLAALTKSVQMAALAGNSDAAFDTLAAGLFELTRNRFDAGAQPVDKFIPSVLEDIRLRREAEGGVVGYRTGLDYFDYVLKGLQHAMLNFLCGRPGHGKSMVIGQVFYNLAMKYDELPILLATTEMDAKQYLTRIAASKVGLNYDSYTSGDFDDNMAKRLEIVVREVAKRAKVVINQDGYQDTKSLRQDIIWSRPSVLLVDYAQEFYPSKPRDSEYADVTMFVRELNVMKKTFNLSILSGLQLSREVEKRPIEERRPIPSDLRATGWLEQVADSIGGLYWEKEYAARKEVYDTKTEYYDDDDNLIDPTVLEFVCLKNRHGVKRDVVSYVKDGSMFVQNEPVG